MPATYTTPALDPFMGMDWPRAMFRKTYFGHKPFRDKRYGDGSATVETGMSGRFFVVLVISILSVSTTSGALRPPGLYDLRGGGLARRHEPRQKEPARNKSLQHTGSALTKNEISEIFTIFSKLYFIKIIPGK